MKSFATGLMLLLLLSFNELSAQTPADPYRTLTVSVEPGVHIEVLDWGGVGRPLVFLAGLGFTPRVYGWLAPRLTEHHRVLGITRRGFGGSSDADSTVRMPRLLADLVAVFDSLGLDCPVVVGHSLGALEGVALGVSRPDRVAGLVFLDGPYDMTDSLLIRAALGFENVYVPPPPMPDDLRSYTALAEYGRRMMDGFLIPEDEWRAQMPPGPDGTPTRRRSGLQGWPVLQSAGPLRLDLLAVPSLAIYALKDGPVEEHFPYMSTLDSAGQAPLRAYHASIVVDGMDILGSTYVARFQREAPRGRAVGISGAKHHVFLTHPQEVERLMRGFIDGPWDDERWQACGPRAR